MKMRKKLWYHNTVHCDLITGIYLKIRDDYEIYKNWIFEICSNLIWFFLYFWYKIEILEKMY